MEIEWVRIAYGKWRCFCYIHGGMIVKNKESGVREHKIGWNKKVMAKNDLNGRKMNQWTNYIDYIINKTMFSSFKPIELT